MKKHITFESKIGNNTKSFSVEEISNSMLRIDKDNGLGKELESYCKKKVVGYLPKRQRITDSPYNGFLLDVEENNTPFFVVGCPEFCWDELVDAMKWKSDKKNQKPSAKDIPVRLYNIERPKLWNYRDSNGQAIHVLQVPASRDVVRCYGQAHKFVLHEEVQSSLFKVFYVPCLLEVDVFLQWTQLEALRNQIKGATVILGAVVEMKETFAGKSGFWSEQRGNILEKRSREPLWGLQTFTVKETGESVVLLGSALSYWGNISETLALSLCELGAKEILHCGVKVGTCISPDLKRGKVFCPKKFVLYDLDTMSEKMGPSCLMSVLEQYQIPVHLSVPNPLDESRDLVVNTRVELGWGTVDCEGAYMMKACSSKGVRFGAIYFVSDFVTSEHAEASRFGIVGKLGEQWGKEKTPETQKREKALIHDTASKVMQYLSLSKSSGEGKTATAQPVAEDTIQLVGGSNVPNFGRCLFLCPSMGNPFTNCQKVLPGCQSIIYNKKVGDISNLLVEGLTTSNVAVLVTSVQEGFSGFSFLCYLKLLGACVSALGVKNVAVLSDGNNSELPIHDFAAEVSVQHFFMRARVEHFVQVFDNWRKQCRTINSPPVYDIPRLLQLGNMDIDDIQNSIRLASKPDFSAQIDSQSLVFDCTPTYSEWLDIGSDYDDTSYVVTFEIPDSQCGFVWIVFSPEKQIVASVVEVTIPLGQKNRLVGVATKCFDVSFDRHEIPIVGGSALEVFFEDGWVRIIELQNGKSHDFKHPNKFNRFLPSFMSCATYNLKGTIRVNVKEGVEKRPHVSRRKSSSVTDGKKMLRLLWGVKGKASEDAAIKFWLNNCGNDPTLADDSGTSCFHWACYLGLEKSFNIFVEYEEVRNAAPKLRWNNSHVSPLHMAVLGGKKNIVEKLLDLDSHRSDLWTRTKSMGSLPLHFAASQGLSKICKLLVDSGSPLNVRDVFGFPNFPSVQLAKVFFSLQDCTKGLKKKRRLDFNKIGVAYLMEDEKKLGAVASEFYTVRNFQKKVGEDAEFVEVSFKVEVQNSSSKVSKKFRVFSHHYDLLVDWMQGGQLAHFRGKDNFGSGPPGEIKDAEFLQKIIDAIQVPIFVKKRGNPRHIYHNSRMERFEEFGYARTEREMMVKIPYELRQHHIATDEKLWDDSTVTSVAQVDSSWAWKVCEATPVLCHKTRIRHGPQDYLVGTMFPLAESRPFQLQEDQVSILSKRGCYVLQIPSSLNEEDILHTTEVAVKPRPHDEYQQLSKGVTTSHFGYELNFLVILFSGKAEGLLEELRVWSLDYCVGLCVPPKDNKQGYLQWVITEYNPQEIAVVGLNTMQEKELVIVTKNLDQTPISFGSLAYHCGQLSSEKKFKAFVEQKDLKLPKDFGVLPVLQARTGASWAVILCRDGDLKTSRKLGEFVFACARKVVKGKKGTILIRRKDFSTDPSEEVAEEVKQIVKNSGVRWRSMRLQNRLFDYAVAKMRRSLAQPPREITVAIEGGHVSESMKSLVLFQFPNVFDPELFDGVGFLLGRLLEHIQSRINNKDPVKNFLDVGCGNGAVGIAVALNFPLINVTAVEMIAPAFKNAVLNVKNHGLESRIRCVRGDVFDVIRGEQFDLVFWHIPFFNMQPDKLPSRVKRDLRSTKLGLEKSLFDPFYVCHYKYFKYGAKWLHPDTGELALACCSLGENAIVELFRSRFEWNSVVFSPQVGSNFRATNDFALAFKVFQPKRRDAEKMEGLENILTLTDLWAKVGSFGVGLDGHGREAQNFKKYMLELSLKEKSLVKEILQNALEKYFGETPNHVVDVVEKIKSFCESSDRCDGLESMIDEIKQIEMSIREAEVDTFTAVFIADFFAGLCRFIVLTYTMAEKLALQPPIGQFSNILFEGAFSLHNVLIKKAKSENDCWSWLKNEAKNMESLTSLLNQTNIWSNEPKYHAVLWNFHRGCFANNGKYLTNLDNSSFKYARKFFMAANLCFEANDALNPVSSLRDDFRRRTAITTVSISCTTQGLKQDNPYLAVWEDGAGEYRRQKLLFGTIFRMWQREGMVRYHSTDSELEFLNEKEKRRSTAVYAASFSGSSMFRDSAFGFPALFDESKQSSEDCDAKNRENIDAFDVYSISFVASEVLRHHSSVAATFAFATRILRVGGVISILDGGADAYLQAFAFPTLAISGNLSLPWAKDGDPFAAGLCSFKEVAFCVKTVSFFDADADEASTRYKIPVPLVKHFEYAPSSDCQVLMFSTFTVISAMRPTIERLDAKWAEWSRAEKIQEVEALLYSLTPDWENKIRVCRRVLQKPPMFAPKTTPLAAFDRSKGMTFFQCAAKGDLKQLKKLLEDSEGQMSNTLQVVDVAGRNLLHWSARHGKKDVVDHLLTLIMRENDDELHHKIVNELSDEGRSPLMEAVRSNIADVVSRLAGVSKLRASWVNNVSKETVFHMCKSGTVFNTLLRKCPGNFSDLLSYVDQFNRTVLHCAAAISDNANDCLKELWKKQNKLDPFALDAHGRTALHIAAMSRSEESAKNIVSHVEKRYKAKISSLLLLKDKSGNCAIQLAMLRKAEAPAKYLLEIMLKIGQNLLKCFNKRGDSILHSIAICGSEKLSRILKKDTPHHMWRKLVLAKNNMGDLPIHIAAANGLAPMVSDLLDEFDAELAFEVDGNENSLLHLLTESVCIEGVKHLRDTFPMAFKWAMTNFNLYQQLPFHIASMSTNRASVDMIKALSITDFSILEGVIRAEDGDGLWPIDLAKKYQNEGVVEFFTRYLNIAEQELEERERVIGISKSRISGMNDVVGLPKEKFFHLHENQVEKQGFRATDEEKMLDQPGTAEKKQKVDFLRENQTMAKENANRGLKNDGDESQADRDEVIWSKETRRGKLLKMSMEQLQQTAEGLNLPTKGLEKIAYVNAILKKEDDNDNNN